MVSDTSFDQSDLETSNAAQSAALSENTIHIRGTDMTLNSGMWQIIDIRSQMTIESETSGGGGHVTGMGGFVSGNIAPIKSKTTSYTTYTYFLENSDGRRMNFSSLRELNVIVGDDIFIVASQRAETPKQLYIPMIHIPAYGQWEIWKNDISGMIDSSKYSRIYYWVAAAISTLIALLCFAGIADTGGQMAGLYVLLVGPLMALLTFTVMAGIFYGIYWIASLPLRWKLKSHFKKMQSDLLA